MNIINIKDEINSKNIKNPYFPFLNPDGNIFTNLILQPRTNIHITNKLNFEIDTYSKCKSSIELAKYMNVDLLITPEYSFPWNLLEEIIAIDNIPNEGKLWILGCQQISPKELKEVLSRNTSIIWIYDEELLREKKEYFNPVCYIFKSRDNNDQLMNIIVIQFKNIPMGNIGGDIGFLERDHMICGKSIYVFANNRDSIHLSTYICSDVLDFCEEYYKDYLHTPFLYIHLQLNESPRHSDIQKYRKCYIDMIGKDVISLNWARNTKIYNSNISITIEFSGSAIYSKSDEICLDDERINNNHNKGLYYTYWNKKYGHVYFLNNDESLFYYRMTKTSQVLSGQSRAKRTGPEMIEIFKWCEKGNKWIAYIPDDGLKSFCENNSYDIQILKNNNINSLEKERLVTLSIGKLQVKTNMDVWHNVKQMEFFNIEDDEIINRVSFVHDVSAEAVKHRMYVFPLFCELNDSIIKNASNYPICIGNLKNNSIIYYNSDEINCNLYPIRNKRKIAPATVAFIGIKSHKYAEYLFDKFSRMIGFELSRRLVIWYRWKGRICNKYLDKKPRITDSGVLRGSIIKDN